MSGTAEIHPDAGIVPSKLETLGQWLRHQHWFTGDPRDLELAAKFRFVDPDGEVGLDCMLIASGGVVYHVPVTWRSEPLADVEPLGIVEHSVLGTRTCHDGPSDPVYVAELIRTIREGDTDADIVDASGEPVPVTVDVVGSGVAPDADVQGQVRVVRVLDGGVADADGAAGRLVVTWTHEGVEREDVLAVLH